MSISNNAYIKFKYGSNLPTGKNNLRPREIGFNKETGVLYLNKSLTDFDLVSFPCIIQNQDEKIMIIDGTIYSNEKKEENILTTQKWVEDNTSKIIIKYWTED